MRFQAELQSANGNGRWVAVPQDLADGFASRREPVRGTVNGVPYRARLSVYGGYSYLGFTAAIRKQAGVELGDLLDIEIEADPEPRVVRLPDALAAALQADAEAKAAFDRLAFTHRKEYAGWVADAKRQQTQERRVAQVLQRILPRGTDPQAPVSR
ncbi:MAG TPA: YdeI/OmpD-associated family protein [Jatrophihabitans sp.]|nr:YdeI/OmpD-associated family protein [Jatrophihabitans sp.]